MMFTATNVLNLLQEGRYAETMALAKEQLLLESTAKISGRSASARQSKVISAIKKYRTNALKRNKERPIFNNVVRCKLESVNGEYWIHDDISFVSLVDEPLPIIDSKTKQPWESGDEPEQIAKHNTVIEKLVANTFIHQPSQEWKCLTAEKIAEIEVAACAKATSEESSVVAFDNSDISFQSKHLSMLIAILGTTDIEYAEYGAGIALRTHKQSAYLMGYRRV